jgi:hypothetical protein
VEKAALDAADAERVRELAAEYKRDPEVLQLYHEFTRPLTPRQVNA